MSILRVLRGGASLGKPEPSEFRFVLKDGIFDFLFLLDQEPGGGGVGIKVGQVAANQGADSLDRGSCRGGIVGGAQLLCLLDSCAPSRDLWTDEITAGIAKVMGQFLGAIVGHLDFDLCGLNQGVGFDLEALGAICSPLTVPLGDGELVVDVDDGVLGGIEKAPSAAHGANGRPIEIPLPTLLAEVALVVDLGTKVGELSFLEEEEEIGSVGLSCFGVLQAAEGGLVGE